MRAQHSVKRKKGGKPRQRIEVEPVDVETSAAPEHAAFALEPDRISFLMTGLCPRCRAQLQFKIGRQQCQAIRGAQRQPPCVQPVAFVIAFDTEATIEAVEHQLGQVCIELGAHLGEREIGRHCPGRRRSATEFQRTRQLEASPQA